MVVAEQSWLGSPPSPRVVGGLLWGRVASGIVGCSVSRGLVSSLVVGCKISPITLWRITPIGGATTTILVSGIQPVLTMRIARSGWLRIIPIGGVTTTTNMFGA